VSWLRWLQRGAFRRSSYLQTRRERALTFFLKANIRASVVLLVLGAGLVAFTNPRAFADTGPVSFKMYLDAPFVENSYVYTAHKDEAAPGVQLSTFDHQTSNGDRCEVNGASTTLLTPSKGGITQNDPWWGGAITEGSQPTVGNLPAGEGPEWKRYCQANGSAGLRIQFSTPQRYLGIWWSAGSAGNIITFYSNGNVVAKSSADLVESAINTQTQYPVANYRGNPAVWAGNGSSSPYTHPPAGTGYWADENFVYLHFISQGSVTFDRVELSAPGDGFEFDNLVTSDRTGIQPIDSLVKVKDLRSTPSTVTYDSNGGSGTLPNQTSWESDYPFDAYIDWQSNIGNSFWQFDSWNTRADGAGQTYRPRRCYWWGCTDPGVPYPFDKDAILYAQWIATVTVDPQPSEDWVSAHSDVYSSWVGTEDVVIHPGDSFRLPVESELDNPPVIEGWHIAHWLYYDQDYNPVVLGNPGDTIYPDQFAVFMNTTYQSRIQADWQPDDSSVPAAPNLQTSITQFPVDPRAVTLTLPEIPLADADQATVCVTEVNSSHKPISSSLSASIDPSPSPGHTGRVTITATSPLGRTVNRYLRYSVADISDTSCKGGNPYYIRLYPLELGDKRSADVQLTTH
jgi:hypothetical protein